MELEIYVEKKLLSMGAAPDYVGYRFLKTALTHTMRDETLLNAITTRLYPMIAEETGASCANIERAIRTVINAMWDHNGSGAYKYIFGERCDSAPGNGRFIGVMSRRLVIEYRRVSGQYSD